MPRKLVSVRTIGEVYPIKGKDRVEMAVVDGWTCMISKADNFKPGDKCIFCETDSVFPETDRWEFLKKYNYRIKTQRFKDADGNYIYSQGLVLPMTGFENAEVGDDLTEAFHVRQYEETRDIESETTSKTASKTKNPLMRYKWFRSLRAKLFGNDNTKEKFPDEISKTDEERVQNCPDRWKLADKWIMTEKVDGQSGTYLLRRHKGLFKDKFEFVVCSRNLKTNNKTTSYWKVAEKYNIEKVLKDLIHDEKWVCIQGEILGPGIQKNKYKFEDYEFRVFNLIFPSGRFTSEGGKMIIESFKDLKWVPILGTMTYAEFEGKSVDDILKLANGKSVLNPQTKREGIVFRSEDGKISFKAVSPEFLIKYDE